jgi:hypothetical protein
MPTTTQRITITDCNGHPIHGVSEISITSPPGPFDAPIDWQIGPRGQHRIQFGAEIDSDIAAQIIDGSAQGPLHISHFGTDEKNIACRIQIGEATIPGIINSTNQEGDSDATNKTTPAPKIKTAQPKISAGRSIRDALC